MASRFFSWRRRACAQYAARRRFHRQVAAWGNAPPLRSSKKTGRCREHIPPFRSADALLPAKGCFSLKCSVFCILSARPAFFPQNPEIPGRPQAPCFDGFRRILATFGGSSNLLGKISLAAGNPRHGCAGFARGLPESDFACAHMALPRPPQTAFSPGPRAFRAPSGYGFLRRTVMASVHFGVITVDVAAPISPDGALLFRSSESLLTAILPTSS